MKVFRPTSWLVLAGLACASSVWAGQKIEFSAPSSAWSVPQPDLPDKVQDSDNFRVRNADSAVLDDPLMTLPQETIYVIPAAKSRSKSSTSFGDFNNPFASDEDSDGANSLTNSWSTPRAWDRDTTAFSRDRLEGVRPAFSDGFDEKSAFSPFGKTSSRQGGLAGTLFGSSDESTGNSPWQFNAHDPMALQRSQEGLFVPFANQNQNSSSTTASTAPTYAPDASAEPSPAFKYSFSSGFSAATEQAPTAPIFTASPDSPSGYSTVPSPSRPPASSYYGIQRQAPPAVLPWPRQPGSLAPP